MRTMPTVVLETPASNMAAPMPKPMPIPKPVKCYSTKNKAVLVSSYSSSEEEDLSPPRSNKSPLNSTASAKIQTVTIKDKDWEKASKLVVPPAKVLYHQEEEMYRFLEETILLRKREVMTGITIAMLLGLGATGTATGVSALVTQHQRLSQLQMTIDEDLLRIEKSISSLERSISSLSEVVLQNRRGLDLLLMQQGGLCAALREECCFLCRSYRSRARLHGRTERKTGPEKERERGPTRMVRVMVQSVPMASHPCSHINRPSHHDTPDIDFWALHFEQAAATEECSTQKHNWKTDSPVWVEQWPLSKEKLKALQELVDEHLAKGHIVETTSPWNSPVFVIKKANKGKWRLLHDLRQINNVIEDMGSLQPGMPSPVMLPQNWNLAIIDIKDCFFQIPLHPDDAPCFAFSVPTVNREAPRKRYHWKFLPQGMKNSPSICQWYLSSLLSPVHAAVGEAIILHYMDDVLVCAPNDDLLSHVLDLTIDSLVAAGFELQEEKIQRMSPWKYLGLEIGKQTIVPQKLEVKNNIKTLADVQQSCGSLNWSPSVQKNDWPQELVAESIQKARTRIRELAGCDSECIHIPIEINSGHITKAVLEHLIHENEALQFALDSYTGEKSSDAMKHLIQAFSFLGIPKSIKTDNGPTYTSKEFRSFLQQWGVEHKTGIPYSPTGQAIVERTHQNLKRVLNQQHQSLKLETPQIQLSKALFTLNFLNCTFEKLNPPIVHHFRENCQLQLKAKPPVMVKDPATRETEGPHDLITWGHGYACVSIPSGLKSVPAE
ncbi:hypothetical protein DUI87_13533 [Hirundo rustica rustica]|uniref:ribonuclease H n=1 Tax=Hirundo rustica rustica TaxID=333673 RepID=A0A3M0K966_HIRRU|nr:hypothetical protein DUI87_13533 [Hirundo rustica rustica]